MHDGESSFFARHSRRSGNLSHCCSGGRLEGTAKVYGSQRHRFQLTLEGKTRIENEASQRRGLPTKMRPSTGLRAKMCSGKRTSNSRFRSTNADTKPETRMAASIAATMM